MSGDSHKYYRWLQKMLYRSEPGCGYLALNATEQGRHHVRYRIQVMHPPIDAARSRATSGYKAGFGSIEVLTTPRSC